MSKQKEFVYPTTINIENELYRVQEAVNRLRKENSIVIPFITDTHAGIRSKNLSFLKKTGYDHMENLVNLTKILQCDYAVHGGDVIDGSSLNLEDVHLSFDETLKRLSEIECPVFIMKGNHDDNSLGDSYLNNDLSHVLTFEEVKNYVFDEHLHKGKLKSNSEDVNGAYGYYDDKKNKIRVFFFDSFNTRQELLNGDYKFPLVSSKGCFSNTQLNWMAEKMKLTPKDYKALIFSHTGLVDYRNSTSVIHPEVYNAEAVQALLKAFETGSKLSYKGTDKDFPIQIDIDFEGIVTNVLAWINGHVHGDYVKQIPQTQIPSIATLCSKPDVTNTYQYRKFGTVYEDSLSVFVITPSALTSKIEMVRFGAGAGQNIL